jgi:hypothetical protein
VNLFIAATVLTVAWGTFAFGAVYPWAYTSLGFACAVTGVFGLVLGRRHANFRSYRWLFLALHGVLAIGLLQLVPLSRPALKALTPATDRFLEGHDFGYAFGGLSARSDLPLAGWHAISIDPALTIRGLELFLAFAVFLAGLLAALTRNRSIKIGKLLVSMGAILALVGIVQKLVLGDHAFAGMKIYGFWAPEAKLTTPFGPYVNKNHFAGLMLMVLPLALAMVGSALESVTRRRMDMRGFFVWLSTPEGGKLTLTVFGVSLMGLALMMTRSRSGIVCLFLGAVLTAALSKRLGLSRRSGMLASLLLVVLAVGAAAYAGLEGISQRFVTDSPPVQWRLSIWRDSLTMVRDFPIFGTGLNTFTVATTKYQTGFRDLHFQEAHNDYLQLLVEGGALLGAVVLAAIVALALGIRARFVAGLDDREERWLRAGATIGLLLIAAQSMVEFSLQMPGNAALFTLLVALALHRPIAPKT